MSAHAAPTGPHADPGQHAAAVRARCQALDVLVDLGTGFARLLHGQATALAAQPAAAPAQPAPAQPSGAQPTGSHPAQPTTPQPAVSQPAAALRATLQPAPAPASSAVIALANAFDKIARTVRRCVLLAQHLEEPPKPARNPAPDPAQHRTAARRRVIREVEDTIFRAANEGDRAETLNAELGDRLDDPSFDRDLTTRPIADVIAELTRDLGLAASAGTRPWKRRTPADIANLHARAAAPSRGSPPGAAPDVSRDAANVPASPVPTGHPPASFPPTPSAANLGPMHRNPTSLGSGPPEDAAQDAAGSTAAAPRHPSTSSRWPPPPDP